MQAVSRPYAMAAAAVAATSMIAVTPLASEVASEVAQLPVRSMAAKLVDFDILNVPLNLFYDIINIPANEIYAMQFFADNLFMAGPWFVVGPTNLWGVDPGDPTHFMSVTNFLFPFTEISGMNASELDFGGGLGQQIWGIVASQLPVNAGCDEVSCAPFELVSPVTGVSGADFFVWLGAILGGQEKFPLFDNWFNPVPNGTYEFGPSAPGMIEPHNATTDGTVFGFDGWSSLGTSGALQGGHLIGGVGIPGTTNLPDDTGFNYMPWVNDTYHFDFNQPFLNFFNSLGEAPSTAGLGGTGIDSLYGDFGQIFQTFQSFLAGLMFFDPFTPGSPFCPGDCGDIVRAHLDYPDLIRDINNLTPGGNPVINEWLADYDYSKGLTTTPGPDIGANIPSQAGIDQSISLLQNHDFWDFMHPKYIDQQTDPNAPDLGESYIQFEAFWHSIGFDTTNAPYNFADSITDLQNAFSADQLAADFTTLLAGFSPEQLALDFNAILAAFGL